MPDQSLKGFHPVRVLAIRVHAGVAGRRAHDVRFAVFLGMLVRLSHVFSCSNPGECDSEVERFLLGGVLIAKSLHIGTVPP